MRVDCDGNIETFATGFVGTSGLAVDGAEIYISDDGPDIYRVNTSGVLTQLTWSSSVTINNPNGLAVDSSGRLLVADAGGTIWRLTVNAGGSVTGATAMATGFPTPNGVQATSSGDVLFVDNDGFVYSIAPSDTLPIVHPGNSNKLLSGSTVAAGNQGHIAIDGTGNIFVTDFSTRIVRINPAGTTSKNVVDIPDAECDSTQSANDIPSFRGLTFSPDGDLVATGYCLDNIYIFAESALTNAWTTNTPISTLPTPFAQNPAGALDAPYFNGPFGVQFWDADVPPVSVNACLPPDETAFNTVYVDASNSGAEDGSVGSPWNTIQEGINGASPGDIIKIASGSYTENVNISKSDLHLKGTTAAAQAVLTAAGAVSGVTIPATTDIVTIQNLRFTGADNNDVGFVGGIIIYGSSDGRGIEICNNVFNGNEAGVAAQKTSPFVVNNTFVSNAVAGVSTATSSSAVIRNNVFEANAKGIYTASNVVATNVTIDHNLFYNNTTDIFSAATCAAGCVTGSDPLLVNTASNNYHLSLGSPAIDVGSENGAPPIDYDLTARPIDGDGDSTATTDMGADEAPAVAASLVPSLGQWGLAALALILAGSVVLRMRRTVASGLN
ncbi:MAG: IPTL-CTERM sorting domain-containing protein [SAR202 cluster bacterium]|jgi:hypothetical protein|nr:hypothetical protein [Chloroflexota bacterium]MDP6420819.1 IPTL-CTERM sorting domain-containing protein [SAR202 cluster bacterium]MDP6662447.1 IPTL-CTERM sorting domain-containing protein [SAR202 cluster bacterium]MQG58284.1 IPTL-CTERM sorting domain-containing protein [SAR202 cluster bacterium]MQG67497.1 IPTL-CTERM sorting domain-containing protein [SAR202 cluster bacterium]|tara:strand:- start:47 stop:1879 length:1833 start_codon:yes stop_codon:yes gene_type:complete